MEAYFQGPGRLDPTPDLSEGPKNFAVGLGFHVLVDALKRHPRRQPALHPLDRVVLSEIVATAPDIETGLRNAGQYIDVRIVDSAPLPFWTESGNV